MTVQPIRKLLVANRSEIAIRVFRSAHELGIRTVAVYSHEDRFSLHRFKADESYLIGKPGEPIRTYLDIPGLIALAREQGVDAIHPGYGFLSENAAFAIACQEAGILFVGPRPELLEQFGDKVRAREIAQEAGVPVITGTPVPTEADAHKIAARLGYPLMVKATMGGGGRGMRVVEGPDRLADAVEQARREAGTAFGSDAIFFEKYIRRARHIEVQLVGDRHGHLVHLFERDCSLQRRHQKVIEIAPAFNLNPAIRQNILDAALAIGRLVKYDNVGTVEFLLDEDAGASYFIEVNPRIQVEHTVTEMVTNYDIVKRQILIAMGKPLTDPEVNLESQESIRTIGYAIQCRITTENPADRFLPDHGRLIHYRSADGMGVRLDAGTAFSGAVITPFYDSMLVKVITHGRHFVDAARRMERCLQEFRIRGVQTNIPFLINLVTHPLFLRGEYTTRFIDETRELYQFPLRRDRATRLLRYIGDVIVNGNPTVARGQGSAVSGQGVVEPVPPPTEDRDLATRPIPDGTRDKLRELGPEGFSRWVREQQRLLVTDTTMRDAHQSLFATRMRTYDMLHIAPYYAHQLSDLFSLEMWGGATFDTAMRFLKESPWQRLADLRERIPNILFQMLLRAANAVGYTNYPDNVVQFFVRESAQAGIDLFRIFDACNWIPNLKMAIEAVRDTGMLCEAAVCYTGDILDSRRTKFNLNYYVDLATQLEKLGANLLGIKDMAGLCKPYAAQKLVRALREEVGIPIHFHTHDCAGVQSASLLLASQEQVDVVDAAMAPLSGTNSQPNLNSLVEALRGTDRDTGLDFDALLAAANYWEEVRQHYQQFTSGPPTSSSDVYLYEMPGGQMSNLQQQARSMGLQSRWPEVCRMYAEVNRMFGDIVKVTPTSKVVGDMALFMVANNLTPGDVLKDGRPLAFPESVIEFMEGKLGQPPGGFPPTLQKRILGNRPAMTERPGATLPPVDFSVKRAELQRQMKRSVSDQELISYLMYPRIFLEFAEHQQKYSDVSVLPTPVFFHGMESGEEIAATIEAGKTLIIKFLTVGEPHPDGRRIVFFELNGQPREVMVFDRSLGEGRKEHPKAKSGDPNEVGAPMPGVVVRVTVSAGEQVAKGQKLVTLEAMKMETTLYAEHDGRVVEVLVQPGSQVASGDLLLRYEGKVGA
jgi:pyruvate carboxylase